MEHLEPIWRRHWRRAIIWTTRTSFKLFWKETTFVFLEAQTFCVHRKLLPRATASFMRAGAGAGPAVISGPSLCVHGSCGSGVCMSVMDECVAGIGCCPYGVYDNLQARESTWCVRVFTETVPVHRLADPNRLECSQHLHLPTPFFVHAPSPTEPAIFR